MANVQETMKSILDQLSPAELKGYDVLRKDIWLLASPTTWDGEDLDAWKEDESSSFTAAMMLDSIKSAGLTFSPLEQPYQSTNIATPEELERIMAFVPTDWARYDAEKAAGNPNPERHPISIKES